MGPQSDPNMQRNVDATQQCSVYGRHCLHLNYCVWLLLVQNYSKRCTGLICKSDLSALCVSAEVCPVLAGEEGDLREGGGSGERHQGVWALRNPQPHAKGRPSFPLQSDDEPGLRFSSDLSCVSEQCGNQTRVLQHYWYTSWPDHKTPDSALPLLQLMADVEAERRTAACMGPVIVHCRYQLKFRSHCR